uniref:Cadherin EGF LAG seven-pass G-type receptor 2 n=1 Tax=Apteryx owenii TaxID=8824 RepID=A0A8B9PTB4_APTOW
AFPAWQCQPGSSLKGAGAASEGGRGEERPRLSQPQLRGPFAGVGGPCPVFEIDPRSGVIRTRGPVDREVVEAYELLVEATDQGQEPGVSITVLDVNDNSPEFTQREYSAPSSSRGWRRCWPPPATASSSSTSRRTRTCGPPASST